MFETEIERSSKITQIQQEVLKELQLPKVKFRQVFFSNRYLRLNDFGYKKLKDTKPFKEVVLDIDSFKMQDLLKISKLNSDLFFIDRKNMKVYSCDNYFVNWCKLNSGNINAIRYSV